MRVDAYPGDVVFFSEQAPIHRRVQRLTGCPWSQVGVIVDLPDWDEPLVLEATSFPVCVDVEAGNYAPGIRTTRLREKISDFDGAVAMRRLRPRLKSTCVERLQAFRRAVLGLPFDFSPSAARKTLRRSHTTWKPSAFICGSLVAAAYQALGIPEPPPKGPFPNNVLPVDFLGDDLPLRNNHKLGAIRILDTSARLGRTPLRDQQPLDTGCAEARQTLQQRVSEAGGG